MSPANRGRKIPALDESGRSAGAECPEGRLIRNRDEGLGDNRHPGQGANRQCRRGRTDGDLQLGRSEAETAAARRSQAFDRIGERMRIDVDLGAELRDEQRERQHPTDQPVAVSGHSLVRLRSTGFDLEPEYTPALAMQACGIRQFRGRHDVHVDPVHGSVALAIDNAGREA